VELELSSSESQGFLIFTEPDLVTKFIFMETHRQLFSNNKRVVASKL
jgi:hypothetical protein